MTCARDAQFSGQVAWRALIPIAPGEHPERAQVWMGPGRHIVSYPLRAGHLLNLVAVEERSDWTAEGWSRFGDPDRLRVNFGAFHGPIPEWLSRVETVHEWGLFLRPVADTWYADGVVLVGDAAHPTLPFLAQGACLGLEDAWVLSACLAADQDPALERYSGLRRARTARAVAAAWANARNYHLTLPLTRFVAHSGLRVLSGLAPGALPAKFSWLYGYDATQVV